MIGAPYDSDFDIVTDGVIDIADVFAVAVHFGESCPQDDHRTSFIRTR